jgi:hypothetical protein
MAITTVRPNATPSGTGLFTITGGSATPHAALSDDSDATFITKSTSVVGQANILFDFGTTTITSSQRVKRCRIRARALTPTSAGKINVALGTRTDNQNFFHSPLAIRGEHVATTFVGPWFTGSPSGQDWNQDSINGLRARVTEYNDTGALGNVYELFIDVDKASQPSVTVSAPTSTITNTAAPDVTWAFSDTDGETQAYYQIKIFTAAQYGAGGFDPVTSVATWDSGEIASSDTTAVVGDLLLVGTYRAYVRVAKEVNGTPFWSAYAFSSFVLNFTPPAVPTFNAVWDSSLGYTTITITGTGSAGFVSQYYQVQRSDDGGTTYRFIRNGDEVPAISNAATILDYEAPRGIEVLYRVRAVGIDSSSIEFPSAYSATRTILITNDGTWWLKAITNPSVNLGSVRVLAQLDTTIEEPNTVFRPLGSDRPKVVSGPLQGEDGIYSIKTVSETEWDSLYPVMTHQGTLLVQDPYGKQKFVRITARTFAAESKNEGVIYRDIDLAYVEVDE